MSVVLVCMSIYNVVPKFMRLQVLNNAGDQSATEVSMWEPETMYNLTIVGPVPMLTLVSTSAGMLDCLLLFRLNSSAHY